MPHDRIEHCLKKTLAEKASSGALKGKESVITGTFAGERRVWAALSSRGRRPKTVHAHERQRLSRHGSSPRGHRCGRSRGACRRHRAGCGALHQRHLSSACRAGTAACRLPRARCRDDLQLRLRHDHGHPSPADHRRDDRPQRRAQSQLHHQRHPARSTRGEGRLPTPRSRSSSRPSWPMPPASIGVR